MAAIGRQLGLAAALSGCVGKEIVFVEKDGDSIVGSTSTTDGGDDGTTRDDVDEDGDGYPLGADCDDTNAAINPGTVETCNNIDDDCDGVVDDVPSLPNWYADTDGDGWGLASDLVARACEGPPGTSAQAGDCDDGDADIFPGSEADICAVGVDANCDGVVDYDDADGDGVASCEDCDDTDASRSPWVTERCNGIDDDCDGVTDEDDATDADVFYADGDGDGDGDASVSVRACSAPAGFVSQNTDCDDTNSAAYTGATETCDGVDNDCDGTADESDATDARIWYGDADGDTYGSPTTFLRACTAPTGYVSSATDCNDSDASIHPASTELCGGGDEDCDGLIDDADPSVMGRSTFYQDSDADGFGASAHTQSACVQPVGYVSNATDCDDTARAVNPGASEMCDSIDNDCDGTVDESSALDASVWYVDRDGDGYGGTTTSVSCSAPTGYTATSGDCNDSSSSTHPGALDAWYDGIDRNCDGASDYDADADGDDASAYGGTDCNDRNAAIYFGAPETWYDGVDSDCAGDDDYDADGDGFSSDQWAGDDCDDTDPSVYIGATEVWYDGIDADCDGRSDGDADYDGFDALVYGGDDCNDTVATVHPYAYESFTDGIDNDCDGAVDLADADILYDVGLGDEDDGAMELTITSGWSFPFCGASYSSFYVTGNGLLTFDGYTTAYTESVSGLTSAYAPAIAALWDDFDLSATSAAQVYAIVHADAVGIYFRKAPEFLSTSTNDFAVILFDDGRVLFDYGSTTVRDGMVGWACGTGSGDAVDWSTERELGVLGLPTIGMGTEDAMYQLFSAYSSPFDLGSSTIFACATAGTDADGDGWTDVCGDPNDLDASVTP